MNLKRELEKMKKEDLQHVDYAPEFIETLKDKEHINKDVYIY